jgi:hypothetical protein
LIEHFGNKVSVVRYPAIAEHDEFDVDGKLLRRCARFEDAYGWVGSHA